MTKHDDIVTMLEKLLGDLDRSAIAIEICRRRVFGYAEWLKGHPLDVDDELAEALRRDC